ncbi:unnamed protein product [Coffea canephora]|uniref:Uncharacterized protein n=1 Tax=Coffea canephora TaxID=49390 RepID=A0A068U291_COFCA|nr:unnamed protein product [Coffea canephora]
MSHQNKRVCLAHQPANSKEKGSSSNLISRKSKSHQAKKLPGIKTFAFRNQIPCLKEGKKLSIGFSK